MSASVLSACKACTSLLGSVVQMVNQAESTKETSHLLKERYRMSNWHFPCPTGKKMWNLRIVVVKKLKFFKSMNFGVKLGKELSTPPARNNFAECVAVAMYVFRLVRSVRCFYRVPTRPGKPGKMRVHLENLEISWNFEKFNKYHGKMTWNLEKLDGY